AGVEVVAGPRVAVHVGSRISGAPVGQVELRVVGAGDPGRAAAALPRVAAPGLDARLSRARHRPEAPQAFSRLRVIGVDETSRAELGARDTQDHLLLDD